MTKPFTTAAQGHRDAVKDTTGSRNGKGHHPYLTMTKTDLTRWMKGSGTQTAEYLTAYVNTVAERGFLKPTTSERIDAALRRTIYGCCTVTVG